VQSALGVGGRGREKLASATCSLQLTKAGSATTLSQQEKNNSADVQRGGFIPRESLADSFAAGAPPPTHA
jgi:hypothetical protein